MHSTDPHVMDRPTPTSTWAPPSPTPTIASRAQQQFLLCAGLITSNRSGDTTPASVTGGGTVVCMEIVAPDCVETMVSYSARNGATPQSSLAGDEHHRQDARAILHRTLQAHS